MMWGNGAGLRDRSTNCGGGGIAQSLIEWPFYGFGTDGIRGSANAFPMTTSISLPRLPKRQVIFSAKMASVRLF